MPDYTVTKAAVLSFSRLLADAHAREGILVNAVCPGPTLTPAWLAPGGLADQNAERAGKRPRGRAGSRPPARPPARPHGRARGDRRRDRLSLLGPRELRHRRRVERRRRHGARHHLRRRAPGPAPRAPERLESIGAPRCTLRVPAHATRTSPNASRRLEAEEAPLSPLATPSRTAGSRRRRAEEDCGLRSPFQRDRDRIVHCKAFRRLKHKTQVFVAPEGDHYRTRLTHTLEAVGISRTVARALRLNEDLTEAIGLGHDLGHPPFGHAGEAALDRALRERFGRWFRHNEHSLRVVDVLERDGRGLNLTHEVRDGILNHTGPGRPGDARGPDRQARRPRRVHQPRHRRRAARRRARAGRAARRPRSPCSARPARRGSTRSCTTSSRPRSAPATSSRARRSARRCSALRALPVRARLRAGPAARGGGPRRLRRALPVRDFCEPPEELDDGDPDGDLATRWSTTSPG